LNKQLINRDGGMFGQDQWKLHRSRSTSAAAVGLVQRGRFRRKRTRPATYAGRHHRRIKNVRTERLATRTGWPGTVREREDLSIKGSPGRFVAGHALDITRRPTRIYSQTDTRNWTDLNHDGTVVNPDRSVQFNEIDRRTTAVRDACRRHASRSQSCSATELTTTDRQPSESR